MVRFPSHLALVAVVTAAIVVALGSGAAQAQTQAPAACAPGSYPAVGGQCISDIPGVGAEDPANPCWPSFVAFVGGKCVSDLPGVGPVNPSNPCWPDFVPGVGGKCLSDTPGVGPVATGGGVPSPGGVPVCPQGAANCLPGASPPGASGGDDLKLVSQRQIDARTVDLTFSTPALPQGIDTTVRVLLPAGYDPAAAQRYPVLYLLQGGVDDYTSWTRSGDAEAATAKLPLITVMPDAGAGGWYTNWYNNGAYGQPEWERFHVGELIPWIDAHYKTIAERQGRAIAGESMGGFGALSYAARHPDMFVAAAGFSPAVDLNVPPGLAQPIVYGSSYYDGGNPSSVFGLHQTEEIRWRAHNPWDLAENLRGLSLTLRTGNGQAGGPYGGGGPSDPYSGELIEHGVEQEAISLNQRLGDLKIPDAFDDYGPGTHSWPYWIRDLDETLPTIMATFAKPPAAPSPFTFTAVEPTYSVYGWTVTINRPALEFSTLRDAGAQGFVLSGSGTGTVTTAALYEPGQAYAVTEAGQAGTTHGVQTADSAGRLHLTVPLGLGNPAQEQFTPDGDGQPVGTLVYSTRVAIAAAPSGGGGGTGGAPGAAPTPPAGPTPNPQGKVRPRVVTTHAMARRANRGRAIVVRVGGLLAGTRGVACGGRLTIRIHLGPRTMLSRTVAVNRHRCTWGTSMRFTAGLLGSRGRGAVRLAIDLRFAGSRSLLPASAGRAVTVPRR